MKNKPNQMIEHVARKICRAACLQYFPIGVPCPHCNDDPDECMWETFTNEAEVSIDGISDFATLTLRKKPRI